MKGQKKMSLGQFLTNDEFGTSSWADELGDLPSASNVDYGYGIKFLTQETQPTGDSRDRQSSPRRQGRREPRGPSRPIPDRPPYNAFIGNLAFATTEPDIDQLFSALNLETIRLVRDNEGRSKGFAYVEFVDKESLQKSLEFDGESLNGRNIRVDVAEEHGSSQRKGAFGGFSKGDDKFSDDWRKEKSGPFGGPRQGPFGSSRPQQRDRPPLTERKKIELVPRTAPVENTEKEQIYSNKPNPFGQAKPRDEAEIERQLEERRKEREFAEKEAKEKRIKEAQEKASREAAKAAESKEVFRPRQQRPESSKPAPPPSVADTVDNWRSQKPQTTGKSPFFSNKGQNKKAEKHQQQGRKTFEKDDKPTVVVTKKFHLAEEDI